MKSTVDETAGAVTPTVADLHELTRSAVRDAVAAAHRLGYLEGRLSAVEDPPGAAERHLLEDEHAALDGQLAAVQAGAR